MENNIEISFYMETSQVVDMNYIADALDINNAAFCSKGELCTSKNKKIKYIIIVRFVSMSYNNTVNWIKVHSTQNCCFSYVYFSMQRVYYLVFVYENEQFCAR